MPHFDLIHAVLVVALLQAVAFLTLSQSDKAPPGSRPLQIRNGGISVKEPEGTAAAAPGGGSACIVSCSRDGSVKLWDGDSGLCLKTFTATDASGGWGAAAAAAAGGSWVRCLCVPEAKLLPAPFFASGGNDQRQVVSCRQTLPIPSLTRTRISL